MPYILSGTLLYLIIITSALSQTNQSCNERLDPMGISHLTVNSESDYYFCFGFLHAKYRAWQMDYFRRTALGKNAEVLGYSHLKSDLMMRLLDLPRIANRIWTDMTPMEQEPWINYAKGVNSGLVIGNKSKEFQMANYEPENWEPEHALLVLLLQSFDQTRKTFTKDYENQLAVGKYGDKAKDLFNFDNLPWDDTILKNDEYPKKVLSKYSSTNINNNSKHYPAPQLWSNFPSPLGLESGSNNWVISKNKTKNKVAILANDPHLNLKTPLYWYWLDIKIKNSQQVAYQVIGGSIPGIPVVASGTNGKTAWGLTNAYINSADLFFINDAPEKKLETIRPVVWFKFGFLKLPFFFKSFEKTNQGFAVLPLDNKSTDRIILRWAGYWLKPKDILPILDMPKTKNVVEMDNNLKKVNIPAWNYVFADINGDIGYRVIGNAFKQNENLNFGIPSLPYKELMNAKFLTPEEKPALLKPKRDYIYTANHRHWPSDALFHGGDAYTQSFRGYRLNELLGFNKNQKHDLKSMQDIQCDRQAVDARFFLPILLKITQEFSAQNIEIQNAHQILSSWKYDTGPECIACGIYRRWIDLIQTNWKTQEAATFRILQDVSSENKNFVKEQLLLALKETKGRPWKELHLNSFKHFAFPEGSKLPIDWIFAPRIFTQGDTHSVNPGTAKWDSELEVYEQYSGASMRMIIEMHKSKPKIWLSLPGKNINYSSTDFSNDQTWQNWANCSYQEVSWENL